MEEEFPLPYGERERVRGMWSTVEILIDPSGKHLKEPKYLDLSQHHLNKRYRGIL